MAQEGLTFEKTVHDFGEIRETDGAVSCVFTAENRSERPFVILDVVSSCGCTAPSFSRKPVLAGERSEIGVSFDPTNRPGVFEKDLAVYSAERELVATLTLRGVVIPRPKSIEELYPIDAGGGLRLGSNTCAFTYIYSGTRLATVVEYVNTSSLPVRVELRPRKESGLLRISAPRMVSAGEKGQIEVAYENPAAAPRYGTVSDAVEILVDGRSVGATLLVHAIGADNPNLIAKELAPKMEISENILKFEAVKADDGIARRRLTIRNGGRSILRIRAVESAGRVKTTLKAGDNIAAGASLTAEVAVDPAMLDAGIMSDWLTIVTNDPERPMRRIRVTAIIEK